MNYEFPRIVHIQQALDAIKGDEDLFYVVEKDGYTVINYKLPCNKTFPPVTNRNTAIRRELRGIKFDSATGETISRPYHKFFNAGEREETLLPSIDISKIYNRLEKLDGSMVHPLRIRGAQRWATKMGITDTSMQTENWLVANHYQEIIEFCNEAMDDGFTPIFEWCSRLNRIVVDYPVDRLVLTAVRHTLDGWYMTYDEMVVYDAVKEYGIEVVSKNEAPLHSMEEYVNFIYELKSDEMTEGEVLRFSDGHMVKVKTQDYINLHRTKDKIQRERHFVAILLAGQLDDLKPFMLAEDLTKAEAYEIQLNQNITELCRTLFHEVNAILKVKLPRKDFAINSKAPPLIKSIIFHLWDRDFPLDEMEDEIMNRLREACESEQKFERVKPLILKGCEW
jgi:RNA ligase